MRSLLGLQLIGMVGLLAACQEQEVTPVDVIRPVKTMVVGSIDPFAERWFAGRAKATQEVDLSFRVSGPLVAFPVQVGTEVAAGDLLARIDPADFQAEVDRLAASLDRTRAALRNAELTLARSTELRSRGHVAQAKLDEDAALADQAKADVAAAEAALASAQLQRDYTRLAAPFAGTVVATYVQNFEDVQAKQAVLRVLDTSRIKMVVDIPETMISYAPTAFDIRVVYDAFPEHVIPAQISEIGTEANLTTRTYPVTLIMDQPEAFRILPGMAGRSTGRAPASPGTEGHIVPVTAIASGETTDETTVWVVDTDARTVSSRQVAIGPLTDQGITVTDGLSEGDVIVTAGVSFLRDGQPVRLLDE